MVGILVKFVSLSAAAIFLQPMAQPIINANKKQRNAKFAFIISQAALWRETAEAELTNMN